jgi:UPF0716 protein FxsA
MGAYTSRPSMVPMEDPPSQGAARQDQDPAYSGPCRLSAMSLLGRLALLFVIVPILELMLLIQLGQIVGLVPTLMLVLLTGVGGAILARAEGLRVFFQFQRELAAGRLPGQAMLDGIAVLIGGAFLLTPGVLTDLVGFSLLFPLSRRWIQGRVRARLERQIADGSVRVITMGPGMMGGFWTSGDGGSQPGGSRSEDADFGEQLDPRKGIVIEPED